MTKPQEVGTRFPFINLEKALERARQLYEADHRGRPLAVPTAFAAWGYSDKSSGGHQTVAALKMYGLATDSGANAERRIALTGEALRYFADERDDERQKLRRSFALKPRLVSAVWPLWGASPPSDNVARSHLKVDRKLNEQSARSFLSIYKDNLAFAELGGPGIVFAPPSSEESDEAETEDQRDRPAVGDWIQWSPGGVDHFPTPARVRAVTPDGEWLFVENSETGIQMADTQVVRKGEAGGPAIPPAPPARSPTLAIPPAPADMKRDVFSLDEGEVTITFPATLTKASYDDLVDWLELVKRKAERAIKPEQDA